MPRRSLLLAALLALTLPVALAQHAPGRAHFPGLAARRPSYAASALLPGLVPAAPATPVPTVRAAAAYAPLTAASPPLAAEPLPLFSRRDLTGAQAGPPYDRYQNLPEEFRKRTLPAVWAEPLPLQLLRGALSR